MEPLDSDRIKIADLADRPIREFELPDGTVLTLRAIREADYYTYEAVREAHLARVERRRRLVLALAQSSAEEIRSQMEAATGQVRAWQDEERRRLADQGVSGADLEAAVNKAVRHRILSAADDEGRELIDEQLSEDRLPLHLTDRYLLASLVALFIEPKQSPEELLNTLGTEILHIMHGLVLEHMRGDAAKKRLAALSQTMT